MNRTGTILVVDGDTGVLHMIDVVLSRAGWHVVTVRQERDAVEIINQGGRALSLVVADVVTPERGGAAVAEACQNAVPPIPVLLMSALNNVYTAGLPMIRKPFTPRAFLAAVRAILR